MFRAHVLIIRRSKLHYTASGIVTPIGGRLVHRLMDNKAFDYRVHETATYTREDTRGCVMQFLPPDDEHVCSKHVGARNELIVKQKFCASSWLITEINIPRCTVSKTSKLGLLSSGMWFSVVQVICTCCLKGICWYHLQPQDGCSKFLKNVAVYSTNYSMLCLLPAGSTSHRHQHDNLKSNVIMEAVIPSCQNSTNI